MRSLRWGLVAAIAAALFLVGTLPVIAQLQVCQSTEQSTEEVLPGITLTWDSAFLCADAPDSGQYQFAVTVTYVSGSQAIQVQNVMLALTTPRPFGQGPEATSQVAGLPFALIPGNSASFTVTGDYELVATDEGMLANLHFLVQGQALVSREFFYLGVNVALRGGGESDFDDDPEDQRPAWAGPPAWVPGPPPWAPGPPDWVPGPPPWVEDRQEQESRGPRRGRR